jgi:hypothetical protein
MSSGEEGTHTPDPIYRSRHAILRQRIATAEAELHELRAELSGLPEVRADRVHRILGALAAFAVVAVAAFFLRRGPDAFTFRPMLHNAGWTLTFQFQRPIRCIDVIVEAQGGRRDRVSCLTISSSPQMAQAALTLDQARTPSTLTVEYEVEGIGGGLRRATTAFDPVASQIAEVHEIMNMVGQWAEGRDVDGRRLLHFTQLLSYASVLDEIRYGLDDGPLDHTVRFGRRNQLGVRSDDELYREIPASVRSVTVQITFVDGTTMIRRVPVTMGGDPPYPLARPVMPRGERD